MASDLSAAWTRIDPPRGAPAAAAAGAPTAEVVAALARDSADDDGLPRSGEDVAMHERLSLFGDMVQAACGKTREEFDCGASERGRARLGMRSFFGAAMYGTLVLVHETIKAEMHHTVPLPDLAVREETRALLARVVADAIAAHSRQGGGGSVYGAALASAKDRGAEEQLKRAIAGIALRAAEGAPAPNHYAAKDDTPAPETRYERHLRRVGL